MILKEYLSINDFIKFHLFIRFRQSPLSIVYTDYYLFPLSIW